MFFFEHHGLDAKDLYRVRNLHGSSFPAHMHRAGELLAVTGGVLEVCIEQQRYTLASGQLAFLFPGQIHSFIAREDTVFAVVLFSPELVGDFFAAHKGLVPQSSLLRPASLPAFDAATTVYGQKALLYELCDQLCAATAFTPVPDGGGTAVIQQIFAFVDSHYKTDCSLKHLAAVLQYDYAHLSRLFTKMTGIHFTEYVNTYRVSQACLLLRNSDSPVQEIAAACGYNGLRSFHRNFQAVVGCTPAAYRAGGGGR